MTTLRYATPPGSRMGDLQTVPNSGKRRRENILRSNENKVLANENKNGT